MAAPKGNRYAVGNNGGRPPKYDDPKVLEEKVIEYFDWIEGESHEEKREDEDGEEYTITIWDRQPERPTVTGLALYLGFCSRQSLYDNMEKEEFSYPIKKALLIVEKEYEMNLESKYATGAIFALKNFGWTDKQEIEHKGITVTIDWSE